MARWRLFSVVFVALIICAGAAQAQVQENWSHVYAGPGDHDDMAVGVGFDADSNCYVASSSTDGDDWDFLVGKYNAAGGVEWEIPVNGPNDTLDYAMAMTADADGNCFVTGWCSVRGSTEHQILLTKVNTAGTVDWAYPYQIGGDGVVRQLIADSSGNLIIVGMSNFGGYIAYVAKFSPSGDSLWARSYNWAGTNVGNGQRVSCTPDGRIFIAGTTYNGGGNLDDILTVMFSPDGDTLWGRVYDGPDHGNDVGTDVVVDAGGNVYVTGTVKNSSNSTDIVVLKYNATGTLQWDWIYNGSSNSDDAPVGIKLDQDGYICIGAQTKEIGSSRDLAFFKLSPNGDSVLYSFIPSIYGQRAYAMALDAQGNVYIAGNRNSGFDDDFVTVKFDGATGDVDWEMTWESVGDDRATHICVGNEDQVGVAGYMNPEGEPDTKKDIGIVTYHASPVGVFESTENGPPREFGLHQNVPNPFNATTVISFDVTGGGAAELTIFNLLGQRVLTHREDGLAPGSYRFEWDGRDEHSRSLPSGVYLYQLRTGSEMQTRKMVLLK